MKEVFFYSEKAEKLACELCPQGCHLGDGELGVCSVRKNIGGKLYALNYGHCGAMALDQIEKKPFYHFFPGSLIFSIGAKGCNLSCGFCQNWQLSHGEERDVIEITAAGLVQKLKGKKELQEQLGVAYTYSEPFMWYEFIMDAAPKVQEEGFKNVIVTNGFVNKKPLRKLLPFIDAMNIDVKAFSDGFYRKNCGAKIAPVLETVEEAAANCHIEITYLIIPTLNDSMKEIEDFSRWLAKIDKNIPIHFSRYFPNYKMQLPPTPVDTLIKAKEVAAEHLNYIYIGNVSGQNNDTYCPKCKRIVIKRSGYFASPEIMKVCPTCYQEINVIC